MSGRCRRRRGVVAGDEPSRSPCRGQLIGGETIGFTVDLPEGWLNVPTGNDEFATFVEQDDIPDDVAASMQRVIHDGLGEDSLLAYGGTEKPPPTAKRSG